jgi:hypothetical protein
MAASGLLELALDVGLDLVALTERVILCVRRM